MVASNYSLLSAFIFTLVTVLQLVRAARAGPSRLARLRFHYGQVGLPALFARATRLSGLKSTPSSSLGE